MICFFVSDLHGKRDRYVRLFAAIRNDRPEALFIGGDFMPSGLGADSFDGNFVRSFLGTELATLEKELGAAYPRVFLVYGNDDLRSELPVVEELEQARLIDVIHERTVVLGRWRVLGYPYVPPTPFLLKDWEKYDVGRYVEPGCVSPEEGRRSVPVDPLTTKYATIQSDLERISGGEDQSTSVWLFHSPPYETHLDRAALDGKSIDYVPLDVHVGSIAIRRFIEDRQPHVPMHGHVHEAARRVVCWIERIGTTEMFGAAHDGPELALVRFDLDDPAAAVRELL